MGLGLQECSERRGLGHGELGYDELAEPCGGNVVRAAASWEWFEDGGEGSRTKRR